MFTKCKWLNNCFWQTLSEGSSLYGDAKFVGRITVHFNLVHWPNCHIWGLGNTRIFVEKKIFSNVSRWCAFCSGWISGSFLFRNEAVHALTVGSLRYGNIINHSLGHNWKTFLLKRYGFWKMEYLQYHPWNINGSTRILIWLYHLPFWDQNCPPRSCDSTPVYIFL